MGFEREASGVTPSILALVLEEWSCHLLIGGSLWEEHFWWGKIRISVLEKLNLKVPVGHPCGVAKKAASDVKQKQRTGHLTCQL